MNPYIPNKEIELAARTGFLSKSLWLKYFATGTVAWRNRVWKNFVYRGYFEPHPSRRANDVVVLNAKNLYVKKYAASLVQPPPVSVLDHDEIVVETYLRFEKLKSLAYSKFEAEIKKEYFSDKKNILLHQSVKFPDLLISLKGPVERKRIAIEVELSRKEPKRR